jgi:hypothetical protein
VKEATSTYKKGKIACCFFSCPTDVMGYFLSELELAEEYN